MYSGPATCLCSAAADTSFPRRVPSSKDSRRHALRRWSTAMVGGRQGELYGGSGRLGFTELAQFSTRKGKNGDLLVVRFQTSTNSDPQQQQQVEENERPRGPFGVSHKIGDIVGDKYRILGVLGQGGVGTTYEAEIMEDAMTNMEENGGGTTVALKALSLRNMKVWKDLELFEREARLLKSLRHPNIPEYLDYFEVDSPSDRAFYIAQKVAKGSSLADLVRNGWRFTEEEVVRIGMEILEVLKYLGSLRPPVYHRDIKPENVILDNDSKNVKVVDFGAVQDAASVTLIGSTVIGTYGYMAPEQFQNRATSQTDLYGLGGTLLFLLSGRSPSSFPQKRLKVEFSSVTISPRLAAVIDKLLEPVPEDRFQSPLEVIKALKSVDEPIIARDYRNSKTYAHALKQQKVPAGTKVDLQRSLEGLEITIPPGSLTPETIGTGTFAVAWNAFIAVWTKLALSQGPFALFSLPFWFVGIMLVRRTVSQVFVTVNLKIDEQNFAMEWRVGDIWKHRVAGNAADIISAELFVEEVQNGRSITSCRIVEGVNVHSFGSGLKPLEKRWIVQEIRSFLGFLPEDLMAEALSRARRSDPWDDEGLF